MTAVHPEIPSADDELVTQILARRGRRTPRLTLALVVLVAAAAAFVGGIEAQKHWGHSSGGAAGSASASAFRSQIAAALGRAGRAGGARAGGFGGGAGATGFGGFGGGSSIVGTVSLIKGSTLYVQEASGNTVLVRTSPAATVTKTVTGTVGTIVPGDTVTVFGTAATNGSTTARSISIGANGG